MNEDGLRFYLQLLTGKIEELEHIRQVSLLYIDLLERNNAELEAREVKRAA